MKNEEEASINYANEVIFHQKQAYTQLNYYLRFENLTSKAKFISLYGKQHNLEEIIIQIVSDLHSNILLSTSS